MPRSERLLRLRLPIAIRVAAVLGVVASRSFAQEPEPGKRYETTVHARPRRDDGNPVIVFTARELEERGAQNLKEALALIPEVQVRQGGMGTRFDIRGAQPRSILLLIDGVPVDDPYSGAYEISSIPITDIVEIRVQLAPASPLEGPGGDGGIVEVATLRATGNRRIQGRVVGGTQPYGEGAATGRTPLDRSGRLALRASVGAHGANPSYPVIAPDGNNARFADQDWQAYTALRLEYANERGRFTADVWYGRRAYFIPPSDVQGALVQHIRGQDAARAVIGGELNTHGFRLALGGYGLLLSQSTAYFTDYTLARLASRQELLSGRVGAAAHLDRPFAWRGLSGVFSARLSFDGEGAQVRQTAITGAYGFDGWAELAVGGRLRWRWLTLDAAVGALVPFQNASSTWPEAKVMVGFHPARVLDVLVIGARKGRLPTIRELYDPVQGNAGLHPEMVWHGEVQVQARPHALVLIRLSGYLRRVDGAIRLDPTLAGGVTNPNARNVNLGTIDVHGLETAIDVARDRLFGGGITYIFEDAWSPTLGNEPIANFPHHRVDAYLSTTFWRRRMGALARVKWLSERVVQSTTLSRYALLEVSLWGRITTNLRGTLRIDNLTNASYELLPGLRALGTTATVTLEGVWE